MKTLVLIFAAATAAGALNVLAPSHHNRRVNLAAAHDVSQPHVYDHSPTYSASPTYMSRPPPPPSYVYSKPYVWKRPFYYHSYSVDKQQNMSSLYSYLMPLALLGISIPALGLMYTYFSRRRRRDLHLSMEEELEYYAQVWRNSLGRFQAENND
ncbi:hypothetical protein C0J52_00895 [Blattella germanica]|nr:hypothetical protein C0J52_00895 [Blattella germanica]